MRDYQKIIQNDINWLFNHYELEDCQIIKSVEDDREWDYILKLKMGKPKIIFHGIRKNEDGTVDCIPPWTPTKLLQTLEEKTK